MNVDLVYSNEVGNKSSIVDRIDYDLVKYIFKSNRVKSK